MKNSVKYLYKRLKTKEMMETCDICGKEVHSIYVNFNPNNGDFVSGHKHCIKAHSFDDEPLVTIPMNPFADEKEIEDLQDERDTLIQDLEQFTIPQDEKRFVIRKIRNITNKLIEKAKYLKGLKK